MCFTVVHIDQISFGILLMTMIHASWKQSSFMRKFFLSILIAASYVLVSLTAFPQTSSYATRMWYTKPSVNWNEALPIGNGRLGAMVFGGVVTEHFSLNEQTLWSGTPSNGDNPGAKAYLSLVREAALKNEYKKADSLSRFMQGPWTESYMPMADLWIKFQNIVDSSNYERRLDLDSAMTTTAFGPDSKRYVRTAFSSFPDQNIVIHQSCNAKASISFTAFLNSKLRYKISRVSNSHLVIKGKCPKHVEPAYLWRLPIDRALIYSDDDSGEGMNFEVHLLIKTEGGKISATSDGIKVENADVATLFISAATSFNGYNKSPGLEGKDPSVDANKFLNAAALKSFDESMRRHVSDYQPIFRRVRYYLGESKNKSLPTDVRLKEMKTYTDPELVAMIAQYGRYILIAASRPGGQPANLKGIWNERLRPEYSSNWCIDHDAQMFYYAAETANLSEMHEPFLQFIEDLSYNGQRTAATNYGLRGWCAHHNADIWRCSNPVGNFGEGNPHWATWNMSGPWLSDHLYQHYLFTGDKEFLRRKAWPVMKGAAEFCLDWLLERDGQLISVPSVSPENTFITANGDTAQISTNTTSDIALIKQLFEACIKTSDIIQNDHLFADTLKKALAKLPPYKIGSKGQLLEWEQEWRPVDPSHRHLSHMYPVFPGSEISPMQTPALKLAASVALSLREKTNCSWGFAWKAACWARLGEADSAWQTWQNQLQYVDPRSTTSVDNYGLFPNFFNSDGKDVIMNGNGCATAVLTEMLLQSHASSIQLLPSLPSIFPEGYVSGLLARGGFEVNIDWEQSKLKKAVILSKLGNDCTIYSPVPIQIITGGSKFHVVSKNGYYKFSTKKGESYTVAAVAPKRSR